MVHKSAPDPLLFAYRSGSGVDQHLPNTILSHLNSARTFEGLLSIDFSLALAFF